MATSRLSRFVTSVGYLLQMASWSILAAVYLPLFQRSGLSSFFLPTERPAPAPTFQTHTPGPFELLFVGVIVIIVLGMTLYALATMPRRIRETADHAAQNIANKTIDQLTRNAPMPAKKRRQLSGRIMYYLRIALCVIAVVAAIIAPEETLLRTATVLMTGTLGCISIALFSVAYWRETHLAKA